MCFLRTRRHAAALSFSQHMLSICISLSLCLPLLTHICSGFIVAPDCSSCCCCCWLHRPIPITDSWLPLPVAHSPLSLSFFTLSLPLSLSLNLSAFSCSFALHRLCGLAVRTYQRIRFAFIALFITVVPSRAFPTCQANGRLSAT